MSQFIYNSNDEMINSLIKRKYIHTINVEKVFRSVDRGLYITDDDKLNAYRDIIVVQNHCHPRQSSAFVVNLSAPSVYATALECLDLHNGHTFLNIGSGLGYFSTLAGLSLGVNGINHGIEIDSSLIDIAYQKLEEFKQNSAAIDYFEFCEPVFIEGNACELLSEGYYDRVYCGAQVPPAKSSFMKALIKIGGVLVMPMEGFLVKVIRKSEFSWNTIEVLEVRFADLVLEKCSSMKVAMFPTIEPLSFQELCRSNIRASIRDSLIESHPSLQMHTKCKPKKSYDQKGKSLEAGCSEQNKTLPEKPEIAKRMRMNTSSSTVTNLLNSLSTNSLYSQHFRKMSISESDSSDFDDSGTVEPLGLQELCRSIIHASIGDSLNKSHPGLQMHTKSKPKKSYDQKRKSLEAGCSEQNKTLPENLETTKKMRMNTLSSTVTNLLNSEFTNSSYSKHFRRMSITSSDSSDFDDSDSDSCELSDENTHNGDDKGYWWLPHRDIYYYSNNVSEEARELILYRFLGERRENELSKLLKVKIDQLQVPAKLKLFLNYNKED
ncbi:protein-L-isoaspartate O-methyltransferase domain-containing protein 1-like [Metopolophium dirhodum]|uniref:protein-L-isoaspartate O-methyltransferase domain-containing protein 1-like n=1 Tax=Metopolophium dirhodum TaxID=44670 RepID=UPI00298F9F72|nr:protein-L-isoaspartate O-methyltransferase domain-containing protein 1-like [Metopolophium dirhodum]